MPRLLLLLAACVGLAACDSAEPGPTAVVVIESPAPDDVVTGTITVRADVVSEALVEEAQLLAGPAVVDPVGNGFERFELDTSVLDDGPVTLFVEITDIDGETTRSEGVVVVVDNLAELVRVQRVTVTDAPPLQPDGSPWDPASPMDPVVQVLDSRSAVVLSVPLAIDQQPSISNQLSATVEVGGSLDLSDTHTIRIGDADPESVTVVEDVATWTPRRDARARPAELVFETATSRVVLGLVWSDQ